MPPPSKACKACRVCKVRCSGSLSGKGCERCRRLQLKCEPAFHHASAKSAPVAIQFAIPKPLSEGRVTRVFEGYGFFDHLWQHLQSTTTDNHASVKIFLRRATEVARRGNCIGLMRQVLEAAERTSTNLNDFMMLSPIHDVEADHPAPFLQYARQSHGLCILRSNLNGSVKSFLNRAFNYLWPLEDNALKDQCTPNPIFGLLRELIPEAEFINLMQMATKTMIFSWEKPGQTAWCRLRNVKFWLVDQFIRVTATFVVVAVNPDPDKRLSDYSSIVFEFVPETSGTPAEEDSSTSSWTSEESVNHPADAELVQLAFHTKEWLSSNGLLKPSPNQIVSLPAAHPLSLNQNDDCVEAGDILGLCMTNQVLTELTELLDHEADHVDSYTT